MDYLKALRLSARIKPKLNTESFTSPIKLKLKKQMTIAVKHEVTGFDSPLPLVDEANKTNNKFSQNFTFYSKKFGKRFSAIASQNTPKLSIQPQKVKKEREKIFSKISSRIKTYNTLQALSPRNKQRSGSVIFRDTSDPNIKKKTVSFKERIKEPKPVPRKFEGPLFKKCHYLKSEDINSILSNKKFKNEFYTPVPAITEMSKKSSKRKDINHRLKQQSIFNEIKFSLKNIQNIFLKQSIKKSLKNNLSVDNIHKNNDNKMNTESVTRLSMKKMTRKNSFSQTAHTGIEDFMFKKNEKLIKANARKSRLGSYRQIFSNNISSLLSNKKGDPTYLKLLRSSIIARFILKLEKPDEVLEDYLSTNERPGDKYKRFKNLLVKKRKFLDRQLGEVVKTQVLAEKEIKIYDAQQRSKKVHLRKGEEFI